MGAKVENLDSLLKTFYQLGHTITEIKPEIVNQMRRMRQASQRHCPVYTTKLQEAIEIRDRSSTGQVVVDMGIFADKSINYPVYVEFGTGIYAENGKGRDTPWIYPFIIKGEGLTFRTTVGMHPQPFIRPAWDETIDDIIDGIEDAIIAKIEKLP